MKSTVSLSLLLLITCIFLQIMAAPPARNKTETDDEKYPEEEKEPIAGEKAVAGKFPSKSTVYLVINGSDYCGGTLITESHVLSSAECLEPIINEHEIKVVAGSVKPENFDNAIQITNIYRVIIHDDYFHHPYDDGAPVKKADIGVGLLRHRLTRSRFVSTVRLSHKPMQTGQEVTMVGYSSYDLDTEILYSTGIVKEHTVCNGKRKKLTPMDLEIAQEFACVQPASKPYPFDNGFPAYNKDFVVGIVGQSISANEKTVLYIQVSKYVEFIKDAQIELGEGRKRRQRKLGKQSKATKACLSVVSVVILSIVIGGI